MRRFGKSAIALQQGDITRMKADAIVNAANSRLAGGSGVNGAIRKAGGPSIAEECERIGGCPTGSAVVTGAGLLDAKYVIHAVAPVYRGGADDAVLLRSAYATCLRLAQERAVRSIAFPSLGTGVFGYPIEAAAPIALEAVASHLRKGSPIELVTFVLFSPGDFEVYDAALRALSPGLS